MVIDHAKEYVFERDTRSIAWKGPTRLRHRLMRAADGRELEFLVLPGDEYDCAADKREFVRQQLSLAGLAV